MKRLKRLARYLPAPVEHRVRTLVHRLRLRELKSVGELDGMIAEVDRAFAVSNDEGHRVMGSFYLAAPKNVPPDPTSEEYRRFQFELYRSISGRPEYSVANELSPFDLEAAKVRPYPYTSGSARIVGEQLLAQGFLLRALPVQPPAHLLEFGAGWGNTTHHFLELGYRVTAVEVDPQFAELIAHRGAKHGERLTVTMSDMLEYEPPERVDAVVFFASFHHCADHVRMLERVRRMLKPGGALVLAGEPIASFPFPWGVRLDGESLWSMRKHGWLELGFDEAYFFGLLRKQGWTFQRTRIPELGVISDVVVARP
jgi:SAM-dependent methyltransferase